jgi:DNA-directed RNA polymerase specialized sigma24 family protein
MDDLRSLVIRAQTGYLDAYATIVRQFQDMACGYAYSLLGDFHLAEDAAQEAFVEAYRDLPKLCAPDQELLSRGIDRIRPRVSFA